MGTSALIKIIQLNSVNVYKHYDGYPDSTLPWLREFTADFLNNRGPDSNYFLAQLLRSSARDAEKFQLDDSFYTGWGIMESIDNISVDYIYTIDLSEKTIAVSDGTLIELNPDLKTNEADIKELLKEREIIDDAHTKSWIAARDLDKTIIDSLTLNQYQKVTGKSGSSWFEKLSKISKSKSLIDLAKKADQTKLELKNLDDQLNRINDGLEKLGYFADSK